MDISKLPNVKPCETENCQLLGKLASSCPVALDYSSCHWQQCTAVGKFAVSQIWLKNKSAVPSEAGVGCRTIKTSKHSIENFCTVDLNEIAGAGPEGREWLSGHTMPV